MSQENDVFGFKRDSRWDAFGYSPKNFQEILARIQLDPGVNEEVAGRFKMIERLILHSYYEYEFLDVAFERALTTFEMALRIHYKEATGKDSTSLNLNELIRWGSKRAMFGREERIIHHLRELRNCFAHPYLPSFGGIVVLTPLTMIVELINHMSREQ
jgi:hypothetical protein